jgi:hypothetical protein
MEQPLPPQPHHHHPNVIRIRTGDDASLGPPLNTAAAFHWTNPSSVMHVDRFEMSCAAWESLDDHDVPHLNQEYIRGDCDVPSLVHIDDRLTNAPNNCILEGRTEASQQLPQRPRTVTSSSLTDVRGKQHDSFSSRARSRSTSRLEDNDEEDDDLNDEWSIYQCSFCNARTLQRQRRQRCHSHQSSSKINGDYTLALHESMSNLGASASSLGTVVCPECRFPSLE